MSRLEELIQELCPDGVEYRPIKNCVLKTDTIKWKDHLGETYKYIDLSSVDRCTHIINDTMEIDCENAPSRAQQVVQTGDILFGTTRPTLKRYCMIPKEYDGDICSTGFCVLRADNKTIIQRWIFHIISSTDFFDYVENHQRGASYPSISDSEVKKFRIPVPPMEVQSEIVRILDKFTELTAELTVEFTARKRQYEYYRDKLLTPDIDAKWRAIGEVSSFRRGSFPQPYGNKDWYDGVGAMPFIQVADIGDDLRLVKDTKRKISVLAQPKSVFAPVGSVVISLQGSIGRVAITQYDAYIDRTVALFYDISSEVLPQYFVYQIQRVFSIKEKTARGSTIKTITKEEFANFQIPVPSLLIQKKIVGILDHFADICFDLSSGLPAEIKARQKQYDFYRDKLLTFKVKTA